MRCRDKGLARPGFKQVRREGRETWTGALSPPVRAGSQAPHVHRLLTSCWLSAVFSHVDRAAPLLTSGFCSAGRLQRGASDAPETGLHPGRSSLPPLSEMVLTSGRLGFCSGMRATRNLGAPRCVSRAGPSTAGGTRGNPLPSPRGRYTLALVVLLASGRALRTPGIRDYSPLQLEAWLPLLKSQPQAWEPAQ